MPVFFLSPKDVSQDDLYYSDDERERLTGLR